MGLVPKTIKLYHDEENLVAFVSGIFTLLLKANAGKMHQIRREDDISIVIAMYLYCIV